MKHLVMLAVFVMTGCAQATSISIISPQGEKWIGIECRGHSQVSCYAEAGYQCPGGYDIQQEDGHFTTEARAVVAGDSGGISVHESHYGDMIIKCKEGTKSRVDVDAERQLRHDYNCDSPMGCGAGRRNSP